MKAIDKVYLLIEIDICGNAETMLKAFLNENIAKGYMSGMEKKELQRIEEINNKLESGPTKKRIIRYVYKIKSIDLF